MSILKIESIDKTFRRGFWGTKQRVLEGLTLSLREGEVYGFLGHNGAGKSTTMKLVLGLIRPDAGRVALFGQPPSHPKNRGRVGYLSEEVGMYPHLSAQENLRLVGELFRMRGRALRTRIDELIEAVGLSESRAVKLKHYSKGMRQRLGIAGALMNDPDLLLLDEPYSGLDPVGRKDLRELLVRLKEQKKTVMLSSHIVPDVEAVCDRVGILSGGRIARELDLQEVYDGTTDEVEVTVSGVNRDRLSARDYEGREVLADQNVLIIRCPGDDHLKALVDDVYASRGAVVEVRRLKTSLEEVFVEEIAKSPGEGKHTDSLSGKELLNVK